MGSVKLGKAPTLVGQPRSRPAQRGRSGELSEQPQEPGPVGPDPGAVVLFGWAFLAIFLEGGGSLAPGRCSTGLDIDFRELFGKEGPELDSDEVRELLEDPNFEASPKAVDDLEAGVVDPRLVITLQTITKEHRICVDAYKEGHYFVQGVPDGPLIPDGYGEAGVLFSEYTRPEV
jgi:hypothetical protein